MQRADSPQAAALAKEVQRFLQRFVQHQPLPGPSNPQALARWYNALGERGWYVPHWPKALGGLDFSPLQTYVLQRELVAVGAPLPPGAITHLIAGWLFANLADAQGHPQAERWLAGIAGSPLGHSERWRVGVDLRRPNWPDQAQTGRIEVQDAHWVLQPFALPTQSQQADSEVEWAVGVVPGAQFAHDSPERTLEVDKLGPIATQNPSQKPSTNVELGVEQLGPPLLSGLALDEVEALLRPVQLDWQAASAVLDAVPDSLTETAAWLRVPSIALGRRLVGLQQVLATGNDDNWQAERERLHLSQVSLAALQVLEERAAQVADGEATADRSAELSAAVRRSAEQLGWQVAQLEADTLGYFALPAFDALLQHNEGPVRPALYDPLGPQPAKR